MIEKAMNEVGAARSIVVDENGVILAGNATVEAAAAAGIEKVQVIDADGETIIAVRRTGLTDEQKKRLALFDNRTAELAEWDIGQLLADYESGLPIADLWNDAEFAALLEGAANGLLADNQPPETPEIDIDRAEELQAKWQVKEGDLWQIPSKTMPGVTHRLLCGDCREPADVARLVDGKLVNGVFTSPPYAEQRKKQYGGVPTEKYVEWWETVQANVRSVLAGDGSFFVNIKEHCDDGQRVLYCKKLVIAMVEAWGWKWVDELCWKRKAPPGRWDNRLRNDFEPVYQFTLDDTPVRHSAIGYLSDAIPVAGGGRNDHLADYWNMSDKLKTGMAIPGNVIECQSVESGTSHAAAFPVALPTFFLRAYSDPGDLWLDPFAGSGTVGVAAENEGRAALMVEKLPKYCAVILERLSMLTGLTPKQFS